MRALLCLCLAACWTTTQPSPPPPRATTPAAGPHATTPAPAPVAPDESGETVLHTKRWKYAGYFQRLKRSIQKEWHPSTVWNALAELERSAYGTATRTTMVEIELDAQGAVVRIAVLGSSGITDLDVEALRSVEAAAPFGPPPAGLLPLSFKFSFMFENAGPSSRIQLAP